jgi:hypothetical protein
VFEKSPHIQVFTTPAITDKLASNNVTGPSPLTPPEHAPEFIRQLPIGLTNPGHHHAFAGFRTPGSEEGQTLSTPRAGSIASCSAMRDPD